MDGRLLNTLYTGDQQDDHENSPENSPENSIDSPPSSCLLYDTKATSTSSPKRSRRSIQKRVVSVPIRDVEGSRLKGETSAPPSDSWAWRKYGQKPIKGSPYPRGYYRCSSSKGCPARKQVERSRVDPAMVVVTYSCEHNHPWPASRSNNHNHSHQNSAPAAAAAAAATLTTNIDQPSASADTISKSDDQDKDKKTSFFTSQTKPEPEENKFTNLGGEGSLLITSTNQFEWFSDLESTCSTMLESPLMGTDNMVEDADMAMIFSIREEDESFFADLGELPECSAVFRRRVMEREEEEHRRCSLTPWCGTT